MNGRERLTRLFEGKDIDRVPIWLLFPYFMSPAYVNVFEVASYKPVLEKVYRSTEIIDRVNFDTGFAFSAHPDIKKEYRQYDEGGLHVSETVISYRDIELKAAVKKSAVSTVTEPFIKDISDLDKVLRLPYEAPRPDVGGFVDKVSQLGDRGLMGVDLADPLSVLHNMCDESEFTVYIHTETEKVKEFLDIIGERVYNVYKYMLESGVGPVYWISGAEFVVPPMVSPVYFQDVVVEHTKRLCDLVRSYGKWSMLHCHGRIKKVLEGLGGIGSDSIHPIEAPPMGDCTLREARAALGDGTILVGNVQYGDLWEKTPEEMEKHVADVLEEGKSGRFILATTGGPSAAVISERVAANYHTIIDTALRYGRY